GNVIIVGTTSSQTLPGTANAFQPTKATGFPDNLDVFIAKFDATGRKLLWATFLGGNSDDTPSAVAVDSSGNIYVAGTSGSSNFPAQSSITCTPGAGYYVFSSLPPFQQSCSVTIGPSSSSASFISKISSD
ncbi:MAG: SBBP repeat-containing protein, partial [Bryobacteraceae bacterium]